jgi:hypothetical protein
MFSLAEVRNHEPISFSLQNLIICSLGIDGSLMSHLLANKTIGIFEPSGKVTVSRRLLSHFFTERKVAILETSNTRAAATLKRKEEGVKMVVFTELKYLGL